MFWQIRFDSLGNCFLEQKIGVKPCINGSVQVFETEEAARKEWEKIHQPTHHPRYYWLGLVG